jgi:5-methylcytosine-specific restriction endonuclease McrA
MAFKKGQKPWNKGKKGLQVAWNKGIPMREESKRRLGEANKRRMSNPEVRRRMSEASKKALSNPEVRRRMSEVHLGQVAWNKGKRPSEETIEKQKKTWKETFLSNPHIREKMRLSKLGKKRSAEALRKFSLAMKGHKVSEETRRKISLAQKGRTVSKEMKRRISETLKKYMSNPKMRKKMSGVFKKNWANPELRKKMTEANMGEKSHAWKGGISFEPYSADWTKALKKLIKARDDYTCQLCHKKGTIVHHIDYNKKNCNPKNLITLCESCHSKTNYYREKWKNLFQKL